MSREYTVTGFILKKQDYAETDQIITIFSRESGKQRVLVKASKLPTSKLQGALQPLFLSQLTFAGSGGLDRIIRAQTIDAASGVYASIEKLQAWFVVAEMLIRALPDEAPNEALFRVLLRFVKFLATHDFSEPQLACLVMQFQLQALQALGLGMNLPPIDRPDAGDYRFDPSLGGFTDATTEAGAILVSASVARRLAQLSNPEFQLLQTTDTELRELRKLLNAFVTYQLDRELKSTQLQR